MDINLRNDHGGRSSRKSLDAEKLNEVLKEVPLNNRLDQRTAASHLGSKSALKMNLNKLGMPAECRFLNPYLMPEGKAQRLSWALRWVQEDHRGTRTYDKMENIVMVSFNQGAGPEVLLGCGSRPADEQSAAQDARKEGDVLGTRRATAQGHGPQPVL